MPLRTENVLGPRNTSDIISMVSFTFTMRRHLIRLASAPFTSSGWQSLTDFRLLTSVCNAWQQSRMQNLRRVGKNSGPILSRLWTKVHDIFRRYRRPFVLSNALVRLSISSLAQKKFAIKFRSRGITEQMYKVCWPQFLGRVTPIFLWETVSAIYCTPFGKVWLSFVR